MENKQDYKLYAEPGRPEYVDPPGHTSFKGVTCRRLTVPKGCFCSPQTKGMVGAPGWNEPRCGNLCPPRWGTGEVRCGLFGDTVEADVESGRFRKLAVCAQACKSGEVVLQDCE